jgi:hypothetical protein
VNDKHLIECKERAGVYEPATLRDQFAMAALQGTLASADQDTRRFLQKQESASATIAKACYLMADAMLKARQA